MSYLAITFIVCRDTRVMIYNDEKHSSEGQIVVSYLGSVTS